MSHAKRKFIKNIKDAFADGRGTAVSYEILSARTLSRLHKTICR